MLVAPDESLDEHARTLIDGNRVGCLDFFARNEIGEYATAMIAVGRFDHDGQAELLGGIPRVFDARDRAPRRYGHAARLKQRLGEILVPRDGFCDRAGIVGLGCPDPARVRPVTKLQQIARIQADRRNEPFGGGLDDARRAWPQAVLLDEVAQLLDGGLDVVRLVLDGREHQIAPQVQGCLGDFVVPGADDHLVDAALGGFTRHVPRRRRCRKPPRTPGLQRCSIRPGNQASSRS